MSQAFNPSGREAQGEGANTSAVTVSLRPSKLHIKTVKRLFFLRLKKMKIGKNCFPFSSKFLSLGIFYKTA